MENIFCRKVRYSKHQRKGTVKGTYLYASFRFPAIRFDAPMLLSFSGCTHGHAKCPPVIASTLTSCQQHSWKNSFTCWSILVNQLKRLLDSQFLRWSLEANQLLCPKSGLTDLTVLTIGSAPSKQWGSAPEAFRAGHYKDLTETGNFARKVSGTQGIIALAT